jgi:hypothetical protein
MEKSKLKPINKALPQISRASSLKKVPDRVSLESIEVAG